jgi:hypothetical protein
MLNLPFWRIVATIAGYKTGNSRREGVAQHFIFNERYESPDDLLKLTNEWMAPLLPKIRALFANGR